ncbi:type II secretion system F family protein [Uliginosibacterium aquaticum]|uniref:Type II secretion system F family protein n=1 Tax=Uliginosibacterium aquaticum TaxID=2731212 RepID=A0ABX2IDQ5_9RHOO|nr:type II secretion system F family protein [Uliginosibacterium aquaticum]NSL54736.1 type II secretion system F family protein [Uliginosibacterium aquaticum]
MTLVQIAFLALIFLAVSGLVAFMLSGLLPSAVRDRLRTLGPASAPSEARGGGADWFSRMASLVHPLERLSLPEEGWEKSGIRTRFLNAGIRSSSAPTLYFSAKTLLALSFPLIAYIGLSLSSSRMQLNGVLLILLLTASFGYYLPNLVLAHLVAKRKLDIFENFPDALDLMTVCVEAGLGVDAALGRVAADIETKSEVLSEELRLVGLELRAGSDRERALRNLAARTGVEEVDGWVSMLVQADRFGTSIAATLRIQSDMLRVKRRQRAEEAAAKIALKLLFPLIFCIFPSLMLVLLGPALIQIYRVLLPTLGGGQ